MVTQHVVSARSSPLRVASERSLFWTVTAAARKEKRGNQQAEGLEGEDMSERT